MQRRCIWLDIDGVELTQQHVRFGIGIPVTAGQPRLYTVCVLTYGRTWYIPATYVCLDAALPLSPWCMPSMVRPGHYRPTCVHAYLNEQRMCQTGATKNSPRPDCAARYASGMHRPPAAVSCVAGMPSVLRFIVFLADCFISTTGLLHHPVPPPFVGSWIQFLMVRVLRRRRAPPANGNTVAVPNIEYSITGTLRY